ncbi:unnamed protein product, partial [Discosporangium mesarthrocarpum]
GECVQGGAREGMDPVDKAEEHQVEGGAGGKMHAGPRSETKPGARAGAGTGAGTREGAAAGTKTSGELAHPPHRFQRALAAAMAQGGSQQVQLGAISAFRALLANRMVDPGLVRRPPSSGEEALGSSRSGSTGATRNRRYSPKAAAILDDLTLSPSVTRGYRGGLRGSPVSTSSSGLLSSTMPRATPGDIALEGGIPDSGDASDGVRPELDMDMGVGHVSPGESQLARVRARPRLFEDDLVKASPDHPVPSDFGVGGARKTSSQRGGGRTSSQPETG